MPSTPLMASSSGVATVSAITLGVGAGYWAGTTTVGGTTSGYSAIGSERSAIRPEMNMSSDSTPAKIGRSMKNLERFIRCSYSSFQAPADQDLAATWTGFSGLLS